MPSLPSRSASASVRAASNRGSWASFRSNNNGVTGQITNSLAEEPDHNSSQQACQRHSGSIRCNSSHRRIGGSNRPQDSQSTRRTQRAVITPLLVATVQRPPWRAMECTRPTPGMRSPVETPMMPLGPFSIAVPLMTSRTTHSVTFLGSTGTWVFVAAGGVEAGTEGRSGAVIGIAASVTLLVAGAG